MPQMPVRLIVAPYSCAGQAHSGLRPSGFFFGMPLAMATGHCYQDLWQQVGNSAPVPDARVALLDARNLDPPERACGTRCHPDYPRQRVAAAHSAHARP